MTLESGSVMLSGLNDKLPSLLAAMHFPSLSLAETTIYSSNGPETFLSTKYMACAGGVSPVICDRKERQLSTVMLMLLNINIVPDLLLSKGITEFTGNPKTDKFHSKLKTVFPHKFWLSNSVKFVT